MQQDKPTYPRTLQLPHGLIQLPIFLPDATQGVVRGLDASDLVHTGVEAVQMNVFHLMQKPGSSAIQALGGLHHAFGWARPIVTDSGGFQVYSLIHQNPKYGSLTERGMLFRPEGAVRRFLLTPEKSVQLQMEYGADIVICLDDCTDVDQPLSTQRESVARTIKWARRCKAEFESRCGPRQHRGTEYRAAQHRPRGGQPPTPEPRPLLFAVVQGGGDRDLRQRCAAELLEIGFDGFGLGGWPLDSKGNLLEDIIAYMRQLIPAQFPMHALGVGQPANVVTCARMGYNLFDSTMPTRDARHGRLLTFEEAPASSALTSPANTAGRSTGDWYSYTYIQDSKYIRMDRPISVHCDCLCCTHYSLAYLHHLYRVNDSLFYRLATMHNLRFMMQLMARLRELLA
jgi:queuine tRNA-ribosyltransferase